jgi:hypothetical protein
MSKTIDTNDDVQELSATEVNTVAGGSIIMDIIGRAWTNVTKDCLVRLTREGTVIDCGGYPYRP